MISGKLIETIFRRLWVLALPLILVPILVVVLTAKPAVYVSRASVWVTNPIGDARPTLGQANPYLSPAQNQVQVLNDLLGTESFRSAVAVRAGLVRETSPARDIRYAAANMSIAVFPAGANVVGITASRAENAEEAKAIVAAVVESYQARSAAEGQRGAEVTAQYYTQQLVVAQQTLNQRKEALTAYLRANPKAADSSSSASLDINYRALVTQVEQQSRVVDGLTQSLQDVGLRVASAPENERASFNVQDPASLPTSPLPVAITKRLGLPIAGLFFGLLISCAYAFIKFRTDHTIRTSADLADVAVPLLGSVPDLRAAGVWSQYLPIGWIFTLRNRDFARRTAASISGSASTVATKGPAS